MRDPALPSSAAPLAAAAPPATAGGAQPSAGAGGADLLPRWAPWLLVLFAAAMAALAPLYEMDLAQHLAAGEWIWRHRAVPFTEPWAWTRAGQPYFAYSWAAQLLCYALLRAFGPVALHLLEGALVAAATASALWAGRRLRLRPGAVLLLAGLNLALLWGVASTLRPQQFLLIVVPLAWGVVASIRERGLDGRRALALVGLGALAANTHIFFPLTAIPIAFYLLAHARRQQLRPWLGAAAALALGWLLTPYALAWPRALALNFGHNILLARPTSIREFVPGFEYAFGQWGVVAAVLALLAAPWLVQAADERPRRWRIVAGVAWAVGLLLFAYAGRLVFAWWALAFPLVGEAADRALAFSGEALRRPFGRIVAAGLAAIALVASAPAFRPQLWDFEGDTVHRMLPRAAEDPALWLPSWLACHTRPRAGGRIFTEFNYGSELNWRLPTYSPSIDGRTIFPDSDAVEFAFTIYGRRRTHDSTWARADLALLGRTFWLAPVLDRDTAWIFLAQSGPDLRGGALWARRAWWRRWGLPGSVTPALGLLPGDPRGICAATGVFPRP